MITKARGQCDKLDAPIAKYGLPLVLKKGREPRCGYPAIMDFVKKTG